MGEIKHTPTPWMLCYHLRSPEHDSACTCGYRGSIWSADGEHIVLEMGSSPDVDETGSVQGHTQPQADRPTQLADAALIVEAVNSHASLTAERDRLREENERLRGQLVRMADIAEMRLMAIHKALEPASFGVNGIESPEDGINYMSGVLRAALSPVEETTDAL